MNTEGEKPTTITNSEQQLKAPPLFQLYAADVQPVAEEAVGRALTGPELAQLTDHLQEWLHAHLSEFIWQVAPPVQAEPSLAEHLLTPSEYLVQYRLSGYVLARAGSERAASQAVHTLLTQALGQSDEAGVSAQAVQQLRLNELDIQIETVEAIEFPTPVLETITP